MFYRPAIFPFVLIALAAISVGFASGVQRSAGRRSSGGVTAADVIQKEGVIVSLTRQKSGKLRMKIQEDSEETKEKAETQSYTLDWQTMVYKLTERNRQIFKDQDQTDQIVEDINKLHRRLKELPERETNLLMHSWASINVESNGRVNVSQYVDPSAAANLSNAHRAYQREEEERRNHYGPGVKLAVDMKVIVIANANNDTTYAVFVTGKEETAKKEKKPEESPGTQNEAEAARKLKHAKGLSTDAENAVGAERERLSRLAKARLQEVIDKYSGTPAAAEAKKILDGM
jgi:hypothetical protein